MKQDYTLEVKKTHGGQYRAYGDTYDEWEIHTNAPDFNMIKSEVFQLCNIPRNTKDYIAWQQSSQSSISEYMKGYYSVSPTKYGFKLKFIQPYDD